MRAYRGLWRAIVAASRTSNPDAPQLRQYAQGQALRLIVSGLYTNRDQGKVSKGTVTLSPHIVAATPKAGPNRVVIRDCVDDSSWLDYTTHGALWDHRPGGKHDTVAVVKHRDDAWRVDSIVLKDAGTC